MSKIVYLTKNASDNLEAFLKGFEGYLMVTDQGNSARVYISPASVKVGLPDRKGVLLRTPISTVRYI